MDKTENCYVLFYNTKKIRHNLWINANNFKRDKNLIKIRGRKRNKTNMFSQQRGKNKECKTSVYKKQKNKEVRPRPMVRKKCKTDSTETQTKY